MNLVEESALAGGVLVLLLSAIYLLIKRRCCQTPPDEEDASMRETLISKDFSIGETLKRPKKDSRIETSETILSRESLPPPDLHKFDLPSVDTESQCRSRGTSISLEVIGGPSVGTLIHKELETDSALSVTVGRIPQNDLVLNDSEVSGKHALIIWNAEVSRWEVIDMGSLNGTLVNHRSIPAPRRRPSVPIGLTSGDILTLGSTSQVLVRLSNEKGAKFTVSSAPFGVGVCGDAMSFRRVKLPMEDVCHCEWPLRGVQQFGAFCIFDGHGGVAAAEAASRILPQKLSDILSIEGERHLVLTRSDATKVLKEAFKGTEEALNCEYEGCTATVLLLWTAAGQEYYVQCANLGDSACVLSVGGKSVVMTEDHRLTSVAERARILGMGRKLADGETRLCGMNIARALGDKFLKEEERCFSSEPYVSKALKLSKESRGIAVLASDGLWDVLSPVRAIQIAAEARDGRSSFNARIPMEAEEIAKLLVDNARMLRTKDNTTVIVLDFFPGSGPPAINKPNFSTL